MPRAPRASVGGICYHVRNRGNGRRAVFHKDADYQSFLKAIGHACIEIPMPVLGFCLLPNHFHLAVWPKEDGDLSRCMHWVLNTHVRRYHQHYHTSGHIWQGRFMVDSSYVHAPKNMSQRNCTLLTPLSADSATRWGIRPVGADMSQGFGIRPRGPGGGGRNVFFVGRSSLVLGHW